MPQKVLTGSDSIEDNYRVIISHEQQVGSHRPGAIAQGSADGPIPAMANGSCPVGRTCSHGHDCVRRFVVALTEQESAAKHDVAESSVILEFLEIAKCKLRIGPAEGSIQKQLYPPGQSVSALPTAPPVRDVGIAPSRP